MKKIIKPGNVGRTACVSCGCEFTFERDDVYFGSQLDPESLYVVTEMAKYKIVSNVVPLLVGIVDCPCCGKSIVVDHSIIPLLKEEDKK